MKTTKVRSLWVTCKKCGASPVWQWRLSWMWLECEQCGRKPELARPCRETMIHDWYELNKESEGPDD